MAREERSAGVILFRDAAESRLFLLLDYGRFWDYPKGHVEAGEDDLAAARRELLEETGIAECSFIPGFRHEIVYFFRSKRGLIRKIVVFFLAETSTQKVVVSAEHVGFAWLDGPSALERLSYSSAKQVLQAALIAVNKAR